MLSTCLLVSLFQLLALLAFLDQHEADGRKLWKLIGICFKGTNYRHKIQRQQENEFFSNGQYYLCLEKSGRMKKLTYPMQNMLKEI